MYKIFGFVSPASVSFPLAEVPATIELAYAGGSQSTSVVEIDDYVESMDEDGATLPLEEVIIPPQDEVRA